VDQEPAAQEETTTFTSTNTSVNGKKRRKEEKSWRQTELIVARNGNHQGQTSNRTTDDLIREAQKKKRKEINTNSNTNKNTATHTARASAPEGGDAEGDEATTTQATKRPKQQIQLRIAHYFTARPFSTEYLQAREGRPGDKPSEGPENELPTTQPGDDPPRSTLARVVRGVTIGIKRALGVKNTPPDDTTTHQGNTTGETPAQNTSNKKATRH
jgi:hypothetical protein